MEVKVKEENGIKLIELVGSLDASNSAEVQEKIMSEINAESKIVFDMGQCEYISSAGLRVLLILAKKLKSMGAKGVYANLLQEVKDVMEMTGFNHVLSSFKTIDKAVAHIKEEG